MGLWSRGPLAGWALVIGSSDLIADADGGLARRSRSRPWRHRHDGVGLDGGEVDRGAAAHECDAYVWMTAAIRRPLERSSRSTLNTTR